MCREQNLIPVNFLVRLINFRKVLELNLFEHFLFFLLIFDQNHVIGAVSFLSRDWVLPDYALRFIQPLDLKLRLVLMDQNLLLRIFDQHKMASLVRQNHL